jgi:ribose transport system substrate-binding protein
VFENTIRRSRSRRQVLGAMLATSLLAVAACSSGGDTSNGDAAEGGDGGEEVTIGVILKTLNSPFWQRVSGGAEEGAEEAGVTITLAGATQESNIQEQIDKVRAAITQQVDALLVAPTAADQLQPVLQEAVDAGIPVLLVDTNIPNWDGAETFIGTDNVEAGRQGGDFILSQGDSGKIAFIAGVPGNPSTDDRVTGAKEAIEGSGIEVVAELNANSDRAEARAAMADILQANPDLTFVFCANDDMALGAIEAIKAAGLDPGEMVIVGVDGNTDAVESIIAGELTASVAQNPENMGKQGVLSAKELLDGGTIEERIDTGTTLVEASNAEAYLADQ